MNIADSSLNAYISEIESELPKHKQSSEKINTIRRNTHKHFLFDSSV